MLGVHVVQLEVDHGVLTVTISDADAVQHDLDLDEVGEAGSVADQDLSMLIGGSIVQGEAELVQEAAGLLSVLNDRGGVRGEEVVLETFILGGL